MCITNLSKNLVLGVTKLLAWKGGINTQTYNLSSGPHITRFSAVVAKKQKNFE